MHSSTRLIWIAQLWALALAVMLGLGCSTDGDILGLSPNDSDNPDDWSHT